MSKLEMKEEFIGHLADFLAGTNACRMSVALQAGGQLSEVAKIWQKAALSVPGFNGYMTPEEARKVLREFLM